MKLHQVKRHWKKGQQEQAGKKPEGRAAKISVRTRIFRSNTWMNIVTVASCILVTLGTGKIFWNIIERQVHHYFRAFHGFHWTDVEEIMSYFLYHFRNDILLYAAVDIALCILVLFVVSRWFTGRLAKCVMEPLQVLQEGADRIKENDLSRDIVYEGDAEFEEVCNSFNSMRQHLLEEKEKNERYEKARQGMIAGISHDLRTPLTAAHGMIKGVLDGVASTPEQREKFLRTAYRRTDEMDVMLNQLFYLSTLETKGIPVHPCRMDMAQFLHNFVRSREEMPENESIRFRLDLCPPAGPFLVQADPEQLLRVFENLLGNSKKYAESDPLEIKVHMELAGEGRVRVIFADNGVGVPEVKLKQVFEEFFRVDESRNKKEGNGLGLYVVRYLMTAMGGTAYARNDHGFQVVLLLPRAEEEGEDSPSG